MDGFGNWIRHYKGYHSEHDRRTTKLGLTAKQNILVGNDETWITQKRGKTTLTRAPSVTRIESSARVGGWKPLGGGALH